jgi:hypothetical protein
MYLTHVRPMMLRGAQAAEAARYSSSQIVPRAERLRCAGSGESFGAGQPNQKSQMTTERFSHPSLGGGKHFRCDALGSRPWGQGGV